MIVAEILLGLAAVFSALGFAVAFSEQLYATGDYSDDLQAWALRFILALGFLGLLLK